ncbi:MAG: hypothetical protein JXN65_05790 [Clostridia bacterium]|nr:hypothetical protein [Clostridia bacterium]
MPIKCDYKSAENVFCISAPRGLDVLPGRMLRQVIKNLSSKYEVCEFSFVKGRKAADEKEDVVTDVYLAASRSAYLMGSQPIVVFQTVHPSLLDPQFIQLNPDEIMEFKGRLTDIGLDEEYNTNDYSVAMPSDYFLVITENVRKLARVMEHLRLETFQDFRNTLSRLAPATISIYDEADMFVTYTDKTIPALLTEDIEEWLLPLEKVPHLDF